METTQDVVVADEAVHQRVREDIEQTLRALRELVLDGPVTKTCFAPSEVGRRLKRDTAWVKRQVAIGVLLTVTVGNRHLIPLGEVERLEWELEVAAATRRGALAVMLFG